MTRVLELVERFVYDLGRLIAGEQVDLDGYVDANSARRLSDAVRPALVAGTATRPDFGEYAEVRIEGDLLNQSVPVRTDVEFDDRSKLLGGSAPLHARRRVRLQLLLDPGISRVLDHRIERAA
ncbi:MAG: hypothetical protein M3019_11420 [Candidatus Dormibacteraeota bacterium]|nr:hypothetical protein [Candidatus Dormibacteraeota bacterium]